MPKVSAYVSGKIARSKEDFTVQVFRCGGHGGQKVDKSSSGVRIIDKETGITTESRE